MKLLSLKYTNTEQEWELEKIFFFDLTLLVGVSGVGKTQVLRSIYTLKQIASGKSENGVKWELNFQTLNANNYIWKGEFENINTKNDFFPQHIANLKERIKPKILFEQIYLNGKLIIDRTDQKFDFNGTEMPKLISTESAINILKEEELIKEIYESFKLIILRNHRQNENIRISNSFFNNSKNIYKTSQEIKESGLDTLYKLVLIYDISKNTFEEIKTRFIEVFPQIEDIKVETIEDEDDYLLRNIVETKEIQIKETGVQKWIPHNRMSSGMWRTLLHIAEMYLCNEGTVILIDEFENSLGINCIDVLTEDIIYENNNIQFIATSHHPYIINKIPYDYWKIVTRKGSLIKTFDAKDFDLGRSHHDRFMSLINHPFYKQGIS